MSVIPPHPTPEGDQAGEPGVAEDAPTAVNLLVSYNLFRARRARGWTQQQLGAELGRSTGRPWSNASVSAAERAWQGGRSRKFDADEIATFGIIFDLPFAYFLLPPDEDDLPEGIYPPTIEFLRCVLGVDPSPEFSERAQEVVSRYASLDFIPAKWEWDVGRLPPSTEIDEAARRKQQDGAWPAPAAVAEEAADLVDRWKAATDVPTEVLDALTRARSRQISYEVAKHLNDMGYLRDPDREGSLDAKEKLLDQQLAKVSELLSKFEDLSEERKN